MRKFFEISSFILISIILGFGISLPLFILGTQEPIDINFLNLENINLYKYFVILLILVIMIYFIITNIIENFKKDKDTRKYILRKYPKILNYIFVFFSQILPSLFPSWLKFIMILILIFYGVPYIIGFWFNTSFINNLENGNIINIIINIMLTQLLLLPILITSLSHYFFTRQRITERDEQTPEELLQKETDIYNNYNINILIRRIGAYLIDLSIIIVFIILSIIILNKLVVANESIVQLLIVITSIIIYLIFNTIQLSLLSNKGYTIGKYITKLRVIDTSLNNISSQIAFYREIMLKTIGGSVYFFFIWFFNREGLLIHDKILHTRVISK